MCRALSIRLFADGRDGADNPAGQAPLRDNVISCEYVLSGKLFTPNVER